MESPKIETIYLTLNNAGNQITASGKTISECINGIIRKLSYQALIVQKLTDMKLDIEDSLELSNNLTAYKNMPWLDKLTVRSRLDRFNNWMHQNKEPVHLSAAYVDKII